MRILLLLCLCSPLLLAEAIAPSEATWTPVQEAIDNNTTDAVPKLEAICKEYPQWIHGFVTLSEVLEKQERYAEGVEAARGAIAIDPKRADAIALAVRQLEKQGKSSEALEEFTNRSNATDDDGGWVHYEAARAAYSLKEVDRAGALVAIAIKKSGEATPTPFRFLQGRILELQGDLEGAVSAYQRGVEKKAELVDMWFNLALMQRKLGHSTGNASKIEDAAASLTVATGFSPKDAEFRLVLGQCYLDLERWELADTNLKVAVEVLGGETPQRTAMLARAHAGLGLALMKIGQQHNAFDRFRDAVTHLESAESLGLKDASVYNNLLVAALNAIRTAPSAADREENENRAARIIEGEGAKFIAPLNLALQYYKDAAAQDRGKGCLATISQALALIEKAGVPADDVNRLRFRGHMHRVAGECHAVLSTDPEGPNPARDDAWALALDDYKAAGDLGDYVARTQFIALAQRMDPVTAYEAGFTDLGWHSWFSFRGYAAVAGNYGASKAWSQPLHLVVWAVLILVFLMWGAKSFLFPPDVPERASKQNKRGSSGGGSGGKARASARADADDAADDDYEPSEPAPVSRKPAATQKPKQKAKASGRAPAAGPSSRKKPAPAPQEERADETEPIHRKPAGQAPARANKRAVNDVAKRLSRQQQERAQEEAAAPPKRARRRRR